MTRFSREYGRISDDLHLFCRAKGITYVQFVQPIVYYGPAPSEPPVQPDGIDELRALYRTLENTTLEKPYGYSATALFENDPAAFTDDVHLTAEATDKLARWMAERLYSEIH